MIKLFQTWLEKRRYQKLQAKLTRISGHIWADSYLSFRVRMDAVSSVTGCRWLVMDDYLKTEPRDSWWQV